MRFPACFVLFNAFNLSFLIHESILGSFDFDVEQSFFFVHDTTHLMYSSLLSFRV